MPLPIQGPNGKVLAGTVPLIFIQDWTGDIKQEKQVLGPFLNDAGNLYYSRTSRSLAWSMKGIVPSGRDASQTGIITALTGGTDTPITLMSTAGYTVTITNAFVESVKLGHDAKGTATFEASGLDDGGFVVV